MNTLQDIIESIKNNKEVSHEELKYSVLALSSLLFFEEQAIKKLYEGKVEKRNTFIYDPEFQMEESFHRRKRAMQQNPKKYIGWNNDPDNPAYQEFRSMAMKVADKVLNHKPD